MPAKLPKPLTQALKKAMKHERKLRRRIAKAATDKQAESLQSQYIESFDGKLVAAYEAWRSFKVLYRPPHSIILQTAEKMNAWHASDELVEVFLKPKQSEDGNEDFRPICSFGIENRARQILVAKAMEPRAGLLKDQYAARGVHDAVAAVKKAILGGFRHAAEYDICNFYPSMTGERLHTFLPLPSQLIESVILTKNLNVVPRWLFSQSTSPKQTEKEIEKLQKELAPLVKDDHSEHILDGHNGHNSKTQQESLWGPPTSEYLAEARRGIPDGGIPQGSSVSNLVAEISLKSVIEQIPADCGVVVNFADNFLLLSSSGEGLALMRKALRSALKAHPAGPFWVREKDIYKPGQSIDFLGHTVTPMSWQVKTEPQEKNLRKFRSEFARRRRQIQKKTSPKKRRILIRRLRGYVRSWSASFMWDAAAATAHRDEHLALVKELTKSPKAVSGAGA